MTNPIQRYDLGKFGVDVDSSEIELGDGFLREAQNAVPDQADNDGGITKRPGLLPITPDMGDAVMGGIGVPFALRVSTINGTVLSGEGGPGGAPGTPMTPLGNPPPGGGGGVGGGGGSNTSGGIGASGVPTEVIRWYRRESTDGTTGASGLGQGFWRSEDGFVGACSEVPRGSLVENGVVKSTAFSTRSKNLSIDAVTYSPGSNSVTGIYEYMSAGAPNSVAVLDNKIYFFTESYGLNALGVPDKTFAAQSGLFVDDLDNSHRRVYTLPDLAVGASNTVGLSMLAANGQIYFTAAYGSPLGKGAVYAYDPTSGTTVQLGAAFTGTEIPYALAWHNGRLWLGTVIRAGGAGKVYFIRPGVDTAWTSDHTMSNGAGVTTMQSFQGKLYVGSLTAATDNNLIETRDALGAWTTSDTVAHGGLARWATSLIEYQGALYYGDTSVGASEILIIRKFDGTSWATVLTASGAGSGGTVAALSWISNSVLFFGGGGNAFAAQLWSTPDGTNWTKRTAGLTNTTALVLAGGGVAPHVVYT